MMNAALLISSPSNRLAAMLKNTLCANRFARDWEAFWKRGEDKQSGLVGWGMNLLRLPERLYAHQDS